jgi:hypothetical protein
MEYSGIPKKIALQSSMKIPQKAKYLNYEPINISL